MGASTRLNIRPICVCPTLQPSASPPDDENSATSRQTTANSNGWKLECTPEPMVSHAAGITTNPATSACIIPAAIFSTASQPMLDRRQQPVFDLAGELKFRDQRHGYRLHAGEHHADGHHSRQQYALITGLHHAAGGQHAAEYESQQQRLQEVLQQHGQQIAARHVRRRAKAARKRFSSSIA